MPRNDGPPPTLNGYPFDEASSAMQKAIRRGEEDLALFFAMELTKSGKGQYVFKRLKIIASEDVGLAWPEGAAVIAALYQSYLDAMKTVQKDAAPWQIAQSGAPLFVVHAVLALVRAPKSRLCDWATIYYLKQKDWLPDVPDVALDKHTAAGRTMGRTRRVGNQHFLDEGSQLTNHVPQDREDFFRGQAEHVLIGSPAVDEPDEGDEPDQLTLT